MSISNNLHFSNFITPIVYSDEPSCPDFIFFFQKVNFLFTITMKNILLTLILFVGFSLTSSAVPADPTPIKVKQPDEVASRLALGDIRRHKQSASHRLFNFLLPCWRM